MGILVFDSTTLVALIGVAAAAGAIGWLAARRGDRRIAVLSWVVAAVALVAVGLDGMVAVLSGRAGGSFNEHRWVLLSPWGRTGQALGFGAAAGAVILAVLGTRDILAPARRAAIIGARMAAVTAALALFLEPAIELRQVAREPNEVAIVVDTSASMALADQSGGPSRIDRARSVLQASAAALESWAGHHRPDLYFFDSDLVPVGSVDHVSELVTERAQGRASRIRHALEGVRAHYDEGELAGIVLISDGLGTDSFADGATDGPDVDFLQALDTRVHTVFAGRPGLKDISVAAILADEFAFVRTVARIEAVIRASGYAGQRVPVVLSTEGKPLRRQMVTLPAGGGDVRVAFEFTPSKVGKYVYEISTPVADGEAVAENNHRAFVVRVVRDKFRVLQVAGQPTWDVRALRGMLKKNPNVDLISFFILRTQDDITRAPRSEMSLIPFPTRELFEEQLPSFDLIVLQNFNFRPYGLAPYLDDIRDYVEKGGGLVMLGGPLSLSSGEYAGTPVGEVLPTELLRASDPRALATGEFHAQLTEAGATHSVTALRYDEDENRAAWAALPALEGINIVQGLTDDAVALAVHPRLTSADGKPAPVIAVREVGEGRVLVVATDTLWHWGFVAAADGEGDGHAYDQLWENATRWLIHDPELALLQLSSDRVQYEPADPVSIDARLRGRDYKPLEHASITVRVTRGATESSSEAVETAELVTNGLGKARLELGSLPAGVYRITATSMVGNREVSARDIFLVREASAELDRTAADPAVLEQIATATGGRYLGPASSLPADLPLRAPRVVRVDRSTDIELWSGPWILVVCLGFLGLEWLLRQRSGYR